MAILNAEIVGNTVENDNGSQTPPLRHLYPFWLPVATGKCISKRLNSDLIKTLLAKLE
jgi:hypothetical protein